MTTIPTSSRLLPEYQQLTGAISYLALFAAVGGTALPLVFGLRTFAIVSLYATVPILVASTAYFATSRSYGIEDNLLHPFSWYNTKIFFACYFVLHGAAILLLTTTDVRPFSYYALVSLIAVVILFQILQSDLERSHVHAILAQTSALLLSLIWSVSLKYHYFFGRTDVFPQHQFVLSLLEANTVTSTFGSYEPFPLFHLFIAFQTMVLDNGVDPLTLFFITTGLLFALVPIVIYALARRFEFSERLSLVAALSVCFNPFVILYGMYALPRSVTSFLVPFCLLLLVINTRRASILYVGLLVGIAAYHTVTLPFIFVIICCWYLVERFVSLTTTQDEPYAPVVATWQVVAVPVIQVAYWVGTGSDIISRLAGLAFERTNMTTERDGADLASQFITAPYSELLNYLIFGLIIFFVLLAVFQSHRVSHLSQRGKTVLLTALLLATVSVPGPALLVGSISDITPDMLFRFGQYTYPFIMIAFAVGVVSAIKTPIPVGGRRLKIAVVLVLVFSSAFLAVSNDFVASDNPLAEREDNYSFHLSESEVTSFQAVTGYAGGAVTGDYIACRYIDYPGNGNCDIIQADFIGERLHFPADSVFILRTGELERRPLSVFPTSEPVSDPPYSNNRESLSRDSAAWNELLDHNRVYDSTEVTAYRNR